MGTFRGYGALVGINPYREVAADASSEELGLCILTLLDRSGPTGLPIAEARQFLDETADEETRRIREDSGLTRKGMGTSRYAARFQVLEVEQRYRQKSWCLQGMSYDSLQRSLTRKGHSVVRVKHRLGAEGLGRAVLELLAEE
jgi:hypothetical protein